MRYKNISPFVKTFHGVTFNPGEIKDVCGNINDPAMIIVFGTADDTKQKSVEVADKMDSVITEPVKVQESESTETAETAPKSVRRKSNKEG